MTSRTLVACRPTSVGMSVLRPVSAWVVGLLTCVAATLALGATPALAAEACPNEQLRNESNINPTVNNATHQPFGPYSQLLPDCRAYEMVSPLYKQGHDATPLTPYGGLPVAPDGGMVGFMSQGDFSSPLNYKVGTLPQNPYLSQRSTSGWITFSALPPANLVDLVTLNGLEAGDSSLDLRSVQVGCGPSNAGKGEGNGSGYQGVVCAVRKLGGEWEPATPNYVDVLGVNQGGDGTLFYLGASSDLSRVFIQPPVALLPHDTANVGARGIYEIAGVGTASPVLRLVNVDNEGNELLRKSGAEERGPLLGDRLLATGFAGSAYHAISQSGETVFFTATAKGSEKDTLYARVPCVKGPEHPECRYVEKVDTEGRVTEEGPTNVRAEPTGRETVAVSARAPSPECTGVCASSPPTNATFQAASADGSKVFFTTEQKLLNSDTNTAYDLYEYDVVAKKLILISLGGTEVQGVVRSSPDGSHVYFVESGVLEKAINKNTWRNAKDKEEEELASPGSNIYGYDTVTGETKLVAPSGFGSGLTESPEELLAGERFGAEISFDAFRPAWTTPDGRYLVFSGTPRLAGDLNTSTAEAVYRYSFGEPGKPGELTWVSHGAPGFKVENEGEQKYRGEGKNAYLSWLAGTQDGSDANLEDFDRAMSGESEAEAPGRTPEERHDGEYIIFGTTEQLQANDINSAVDVYEWHCSSPCKDPAREGTVSMISDGHDPQGVAYGGNTRHENFGMSTSGSDIFFSSHTPLVGQDTDVLRDVYDARVNGGFPAPAPELHCEVCQGPAFLLPSFGPAASSSSPAGGNLTSPLIKVAPAKESKPKELTRAQKLAKALKACKGKPKKKRAACESQARKKYGGQAKAKTKAKAKKSERKGP